MFVQCTVKPRYYALEGTGPQNRYRRESVIRGKWFSGITKRNIISIATFNDNPRTKQKIIRKNALWGFETKKYTEWILAQIVHLKCIRLGYVRSNLPIRKCIRLVTCVQVSPYKCMLCANIIGQKYIVFYCKRLFYSFIVSLTQVKTQNYIKGYFLFNIGKLYSITPLSWINKIVS